MNSLIGFAFGWRLVLEESIESRQEVKKLLNALYRERSKIVHGAVPDTEDASLRVKGEELLTLLLRKVLQLKAVPDWPTVELRGGLPPE